MMNYIDDISSTLRRISANLNTITEEERKRLSEYMGTAANGFGEVLQQLQKGGGK
jgi:hypothetical protein